MLLNRLRQGLLRALSSQTDSTIAHLREARGTLNSILASRMPSEPSPTSPALAAFDPNIGRNLVVVTPLKPIPLSSQADAWRMLADMLDGLIGLYQRSETGTSLEWMARALSVAKP